MNLAGVLLSIPEAAKRLGLKSPGGLYRKIDRGELEVVVDEDGTRRIEGDGLEARYERITRKQSNSPQSQRPPTEQAGPQPGTSRSRSTSSVDNGDVPDLNEERARHEREKRLLAELARQEKEGELLRREDVEAAWNQAVNITRNRLRGVPSGVKQRIPHLEPEEVEVITQLIDEALNELAAGEVKA